MVWRAAVPAAAGHERVIARCYIDGGMGLLVVVGCTIESKILNNFMVWRMYGLVFLLGGESKVDPCAHAVSVAYNKQYKTVRGPLARDDTSNDYERLTQIRPRR